MLQLFTSLTVQCCVYTSAKCCTDVVHIVQYSPAPHQHDPVPFIIQSEVSQSCHYNTAAAAILDKSIILHQNRSKTEILCVCDGL